MEKINLEPIAYVRSVYNDPATIPMYGQKAIIELNPEYLEGLLRIEEHSHFWVLSWFHQAKRDVLKTVPYRIDPNLPEYGVFGLRAPIRPNPIGLSLVRLLKVEDNKLYVQGLDAIDGTPVLDIKPYFEQDIIFSPETPYISPADLEMRREAMLKEALKHHQEDCPELQLAVRMALLAEEEMGKLNSPDLLVKVIGSPCLADCLQGLTRARLANPSRFVFEPREGLAMTIWTKGEKNISIEQIVAVTAQQHISELSDNQLFSIRGNII